MYGGSDHDCCVEVRLLDGNQLVPELRKTEQYFSTRSPVQDINSLLIHSTDGPFVAMAGVPNSRKILPSAISQPIGGCASGLCATVYDVESLKT